MNDEKLVKAKELYVKVQEAPTYVAWLRAQANYVEYVDKFHESIKVAAIAVHRNFVCSETQCVRTHVLSEFDVWYDKEYNKKIGGIFHALIAMFEFCKFRLLCKEEHVLSADELMKRSFEEFQRELEQEQEENFETQKERKPN